MGKSYSLKTGLSKTAVHGLIASYLPSDVCLPPVRQCEFRKHRQIYWLSFGSNQPDSFYEVMLCTFAGLCHVIVERITEVEYSDKLIHTQVSRQSIPFEYLRDHGFLKCKEVA